MVTNFTNKKRLVYPKLSYILMGILFEVHNKLGTKYQEKHFLRYLKASKLKLAIIANFKHCRLEYRRVLN